MYHHLTRGDDYCLICKFGYHDLSNLLSGYKKIRNKIVLYYLVVDFYFVSFEGNHFDSFLWINLSKSNIGWKPGASENMQTWKNLLHAKYVVRMSSWHALRSIPCTPLGHFANHTLLNGIFGRQNPSSGFYCTRISGFSCTTPRSTAVVQQHCPLPPKIKSLWARVHWGVGSTPAPLIHSEKSLEMKAVWVAARINSTYSAFNRWFRPRGRQQRWLRRRWHCLLRQAQ